MSRRHGVTRREFLAAASVAPLARLPRGGQAGPLPDAADVVVVGGDPAALSAVHRLAQDPALRVVLVTEDLPWTPHRDAPQVPVADLPPFVRGHAGCFEGWRDRGNAGWGYDDVLPAFKRLEHYEAGASDSRGGDGPLAVSHCWDPHPAHRAFLQAVVPAGFRQDARHDFNGPRSQGVAGFYQKAVRGEHAHAYADAFVAPVQARVTVVAGGHVQRVVVTNGRAVGVSYRVGTTTHTIRAGHAVLLAAAPARAAQVLMLSGLGPAGRLRELDVAVVTDLPGVGENLHDQVRVPLRYAARLAVPPSTVTAGMFTVSLRAAPPDLQLNFAGPRPGGPRTLGLDVTLVRPAMRGAVRLVSADPLAPPHIALDALASEADVTALVQGLRLGRMIATGVPLDAWRGDETRATAAATTTPDLQARVRALAATCGHLAGTCAMGPASDRTAVVDATLAVHGVTGLRVAGAAVMPDIVNAPPDAAALMLGERAAAWLRGA